ncbi:sigma-54-dependent Fis family transcriptional regulator [bacterium]|nr:MAG: sigma-54-dependent Fis family transcriptional regulator [bacterium]
MNYKDFAASGNKPRVLRVLVIDDDKNIRVTLTACLEAMGCSVAEAANREAALLAMRRRSFDLAFLDLRLGNEDGLDLLPDILTENPNLEVVVITAHATISTAVKAIKLGAKDYLPKPFEPSQIRYVVERVMAVKKLETEVGDLRLRLGEAVPVEDMETHSQKMLSAIEVLRRAADSDASVFLRGENGTGKGVFARALHRMSLRRENPFVVVNCPTLSENLLASELFGHSKGAFTGALRDQPGKVEAAQGGTLFLDEISEISVNLQAKLLRFLQDREFERLGENRTRTADVRIVAATNRDLEEAVKSGRFREDLLYRLNVIEITVPPLRERREDIILLAERFAAFFAQVGGRKPPGLSPESQSVLESYPWPGNVRELRNAVERAIILWPSPVLGPEAFGDRIAGGGASAPFVGGDFRLEEIEEEHLRLVLAKAETLEDAAKTLGIDASTLWRKRKKLES